MQHAYRPRTQGFTKHRLAQRRGAGFTLVEVFIVIAIIVILAAILVPAFKRSINRGRAIPINHAAAIHMAERSGLRDAEVIAEHRTFNVNARDVWLVGCLADDDVVLQVEGLDAKEQHIRMIVCCRPTSNGSVCALPPPSRALPPER